MASTTVLIVEDHPDNRTIYAALLRHAGFIVHEAGNGKEGVEQARALRPDVVLMDLAMPVMDGITAAMHLKRDVALCHIPIIAVTAHDAALTEPGLFSEWLSKPVSAATLVQAIHAALGGDQPPRRPQILA